LLEAGDVAQDVFEPVRGRAIEPVAADRGHVIGIFAKPRLKAAAGDDDRRLLGERAPAQQGQHDGRETSHAARLQKKSRAGEGKTGAAWG
jgi:hypothetical protein